MRTARRIICWVVVVAAVGLVGCSDAETEGESDSEADTGPPVTCLAVPTCDGGDEQVEACPDGGSCYSLTECGSTITCVRKGGDAGDPVDTGPPISCDAYPSCDEGDEEVQTCPDGGSCYTRTECDSTITCLSTGADTGDGGSLDAGPADGGDVEDAGGTCPEPSSQNADTGCISVAVCCVNETTGEKCWYSNPCTEPDEPGDDWTCGESQCSRDAG